MDRGAWWATVYGVARVRHVLVAKPPGAGAGTSHPHHSASDLHASHWLVCLEQFHECKLQCPLKGQPTYKTQDIQKNLKYNVLIMDL